MAAGRAVPVFSGVSQPFYSVTFRVDVTNLHAYTKARGISFYYALGYLVTDAVNSVVNFRYTIRDGEVWLLDKRIPSLTDLKPGSEQFHIVTLPKTGTLDEFCCAAKAKSAAQQSFLDQDCETDALIYISTTPWFDLTSCTNERDFDKDDAIPRITWGKFVPENGRETLGMSLEVSHRFIDGYHLGQFYQTLQKALMNCKKRPLYFTVQQPFFSLFFTFCRSPAPPFPAIPVHGAAL